ncbi:putative receptor-like protein kinase At4g00960 [Rosa chinensis]|uniref:putative receptor-like protein kinase At4g00960 n=1 Tax=Rosa chinensis TaxID=74649 RepID=UPI001AD91368|nr:putative receptor-like protein kinase At4g00960 [Rosa chinensis]
MKLIIGVSLMYLSLIAFPTTQSLNSTYTTTCPMDLSYVLRIPFKSSSCKNFQAPPKNPETDITTIPCCQTLLSLIAIGLAQHLKDTSLFLLPDIATSITCFQDFQSKLTSLSLPSSIVPYCFDPILYVTNPNGCAHIESSQDWVSKLNQTAALESFDTACKPDLTDKSYCDTCLVSGFKVQESLINLDGNNSHYRSCWYITLRYAAGLLTILISYHVWRKSLAKGRKHSQTIISFNDGDEENDTELPLFNFRSILVATNNFCEANKLGEGGFGPVYKGILPRNKEVAMKRLSKKSGQGHQEFVNELKLIAKLQHTNLVRLLGCCSEEEEMILVYEYMPNRSLDKFLFDPMENIKLDWGKRFRIIEGIAQGVLYIHKHSRLKIIHRDLKASNVLLDEEMKPKISDFGMAKIFEKNQIEANTKRIVGTYGYMSPEYARFGHFSEKSDVFSFGVLLLEIVSGKRNAALYRFEHPLTLAGWAWKLWKEGRGMKVIDASVRETCVPHEALRCIHLAFLCVQEDPADRPTMATVILMLGNESTSLPLSKEPAFTAHSNSDAHGSCPASINFSNNVITISIPEGR